MAATQAESGHWYTPEGETCYGIDKREARKIGAVPGFSSIWAVLASWNLEQWRLGQQLDCSADTPQMPYEGRQAWMDRVQELYKERTTKARDIGSVIHDCIEKRLMGMDYDPNYAEHTVGAIEALSDWCGLDGIVSEKSFAHPLGYGGKVDVHKRGFVADFKSKEFTEDNLPKTYDNHDAQLAAYRKGLGLDGARCAIIYVSTLVPGLTHTVEIPEKKLVRAWNLFLHLIRVWQIKNNYVPACCMEVAQ